ncbi:MAG: hypothetical protein IID51_07390 [Proteobacteria bacterium]|nr:hypothetical protein [Pseudomonadota bacterium]
MNELPSETSAADTTGQSPLQQHRGLVILVLTMGLLLVVGLAVIAVTIIYRISDSDDQQNDAAAAPAMVGETHDAPNPALAARHAPEISIARPAGAELIGATSTGDRMTLHFRGAGGDTVVVVDLGSGQVLSRVEIAATFAVEE